MARYYIRISRGGNWLVLCDHAGYAEVVQVCESREEAVAVRDLCRAEDCR